MNKEKVIKMAKSMLKCLENNASGLYENCDNHCEECYLNYEQGTVGEQIEWLKVAIKAIEQQDKILQILDDYELEAWEVLEMIKEVVRV